MEADFWKCLIESLASVFADYDQKRFKEQRMGHLFSHV